MEFFKQIFTSVSDHVSDRVNSFYTGTFIFSWLAINWKVLIYLLFSASTVEIKLGNFEQYFSQSVLLPSWLPESLWIQNTVIKPLLTSLAIVVAIPALNTFADFVKILSNLANNKLQRNFSGWMSPERSQRLLDEISILKSGQGNLFVEKNEEIESLKAIISKLESQISADKTVHVQEIEKVKASIKPAVEAAEKKRDEIHNELNKAKDRIRELEQQYVASQEPYNQLSQEYNKIHQQLTKQVQESDIYQQRESHIQYLTNTNNGLQEQLKIARDEFNQQITKLQQAIERGTTARDQQIQKLLEQFSAKLEIVSTRVGNSTVS